MFGNTYIDINAAGSVVNVDSFMDHVVNCIVDTVVDKLSTINAVLHRKRFGNVIRCENVCLDSVEMKHRLPDVYW